MYQLPVILTKVDREAINAVEASALKIRGHSKDVPEGPQENSPGCSAAEPWDSAQN
jgi:hypothetical protein